MRRYFLFLTCATFVLALSACAEGMGSNGGDPTGPVCGDGQCTGGETASTCAEDCGGQQQARCGDGQCNGGETVNTCAQDCGGNTNPVCGDGQCNGTETINTCPADCGGGTNAVCGDGTCNGTETNTTCPIDCTGGTADVCGDGTCGATENATSCPADCGGGTTPGCGDGICDAAGGECTSTDPGCIIDCQIIDPTACGGTSCHDVCTVGDAQDPSCGQCQSDVCANDSLCCDPSNGWDSFCVSEVNQYCTGTTC